MRKIHYSKDADALLIELLGLPIAYAEYDENIILHCSEDHQIVLVELLDFAQFITNFIENSSFQSIVESIVPLGVGQKKRLQEFLTASIAQEDLDEAAIEALEDAEDIADAKAALAEPGSLSLTEFRKELGLT
jgi:uncharacterized protein YuzE